MSSSPEQKGEASYQGESYTTVYLTIFGFRGEPDAYYKRHVLAYFQAPESNFCETVHVTRHDAKSPWEVNRVDVLVEWAMTANISFNCDGGAFLVPRGQEKVLTNIMAAVPVMGRELDSGWNCQNFVLEGLTNLVAAKYQTKEWYTEVENKLIDYLLDRAVN
ncbi:hypothetical protein F5Y12DRAFT_790845 [Xylaria sp. FL1777]|nr:hypothetical protein F5Y12DRAFT_790845 [Xylaria sp. FL1777]